MSNKIQEEPGVSLRSFLFVVLAIVGAGALGNALLSGGSVTAHGGDPSVLHLCVSKAGNLKGAYVVSPNTNCPSFFYDSVHVPLEDTTTPQDRSCPDGEFVNGIAADGSLMCEPALTADSFYLVSGSFTGQNSVQGVDCDDGDLAVGGGASAVDLSGTGPGESPIVGSTLQGWVGGGAQVIGVFAVCLDLSPFRP